MAATEVGCEHYVRSCLLKAPCCGKFYVCRLCHDGEENHQMDRFKVREVKCAACNNVQESQQICKECKMKFGEYYCDICHLFDKDKKQYHCQPCTIYNLLSGDVQNWVSAYRCPLCMHSALNMKEWWEERDKEIAQTPMPTEYQDTTVRIICNDCQARSTVSFHVLGMKCSSCGSYNTAQDGGLMAAPPVDVRQPAEHTLEEEPNTEHHE
ncbi:RING finger and CHY zinc finger domain-containing protein 1 [Puntigrus tetrazona]|uniref:RING finger and CHY zinc finger domain-containing protein 1 n=1 Tax=Puntigrus tetrazona TaxID=1606681 RepID=UPI001C8959E1|nr:RING finger and CHY zinc finger domain-containing protein 1 [Puntigrus tetrazona]